MVLQRFLTARQFAGVEIIVQPQVVAMGLGVATPLAVIGCHLHRAVAFPILRIDLGQGRCTVVRGAAISFRGVVRAGHKLRFAVALTHRRVGLRQAEFLTRQRLLGQFQERVVVQHLAHLLAEFERGELQQADRLLQLGRQGQVL